MITYARARGLTWAIPVAMIASALAAWGAWFIESRRTFDHFGRIPAVAVGALVVAIVATSILHRTDEQIEGSNPRPTPATELATVLGIAVLGAGLAVVLIPLEPLERGGLEMVRNIVGLTGLALIGASVGGARLGWLLPFSYLSISYFSVARVHQDHPSQAIPGWVMFPATWTTTWIVAIALLVLGVLAHCYLGGIPRPRRHPLR